MKLIKYFSIAATALVMFASCSDDKDDIKEAPTTKASFNLVSPSSDIVITDYLDVNITFTELSTKKTIVKKVESLPLVFDLPQGSYEVSVVGKIKYTLDDVSKEGGIGAFLGELNLVDDVLEKDIQLVLKSYSKDFLIEEVFFTGTLDADGSQYNGDKYFKIYNNTDEVLYADGLIIAHSAFGTTQKQDYTPNIMSEAFTANAMIQIPGTGKDHAVNPGESFIIASDGINHKAVNTKSIDLSTADFEIVRPNYDVDAPNVKNVVNLYDQFTFHNRGFYSYAIIRLPEGVSNSSFLVDNKYTYNWLFSFGGNDYPMDSEGYKIPNSWVVDVVNLSVEAEFKWIVTDPSLDSGWTYCGKVDSDNNRYGKSVRRKVLQEVDGKRILKDTNNSKVDFEAEATPSLIN